MKSPDNQLVLTLKIESETQAKYHLTGDKELKPLRLFNIPSKTRNRTSLSKVIEDGELLFDKSLGALWQGLPDRFKPEGRRTLHLRILSKEPSILRLPWFHLAHESGLLLKMGFRISLSSCTEEEHIFRPRKISLSYRPRLLLVLPKNRLNDNEEHGKDIKSSLASQCEVRIVHTFEDFLEAYESSPPEILYLRTHAKRKRKSLYLEFDQGTQKCLLQEAANLAVSLRSSGRKSRGQIAIFNACHADSALGFSLTSQLEDLFAAIFAYRDEALEKNAMNRGFQLLNDILLDGLRPEDAFAKRYATYSGGSEDWKQPIKPTFYCNYEAWSCDRSTVLDYRSDEFDWSKDLGRARQFAQVAYEARQTFLQGELENHLSRGRAVIWYGKQGQGVNRFRSRIENRLDDELPEGAILERREPEWPNLEYYDLRWANVPNAGSTIKNIFVDMLRGAFDLERQESFRHSIAELVQLIIEVFHNPESPTLIHFDHSTIVSKPLSSDNSRRTSYYCPIPPQWIFTYLRLWQDDLAPRLISRRIYPFLTIPYIVRDIRKFGDNILKHRQSSKLKFLDISILDPFEDITKEEVEAAMRAQGSQIDSEDLEQILPNEKGRFKETVDSLRIFSRKKYTLVDPRGVEID